LVKLELHLESMEFHFEQEKLLWEDSEVANLGLGLPIEAWELPRGLMQETIQGWERV